MDKTNVFNLRQESIRPSALTDEQLRCGRRIMEDTFMRVLDSDNSERMRWTGTQTDLMELAYVAYQGGTVRDSHGCPATLASLVRRICCKLHTHVPYSPYNMAARARLRKGVKRPTLTERVSWMKFVEGEDNPLKEMISIKE